MPFPVPMPRSPAGRLAWLRRDPARRFQFELIPCLRIARRAKGGGQRRSNRNTSGRESPATTRSIAAAFRAYDALLARALRWPNVSPADRFNFYRIHASARLMDAALSGTRKGRVLHELARCRELVVDDTEGFALDLACAINWAVRHDRRYACELRAEFAAFLKRRAAVLEGARRILRSSHERMKNAGKPGGFASR